MLEGDNMYTCSKCQKKVRAEKRSVIFVVVFGVCNTVYLFIKWRQKSGILNDGYNKNNLMIPLVGLMIFSRRWFYMHLGYPKLFDGNVTLSLKTLSFVI